MLKQSYRSNKTEQITPWRPEPYSTVVLIGMAVEKGSRCYLSSFEGCKQPVFKGRVKMNFANSRTKNIFYPKYKIWVKNGIFRLILTPIGWGLNYLNKCQHSIICVGKHCDFVRRPTRIYRLTSIVRRKVLQYWNKMP